MQRSQKCYLAFLASLCYTLTRCKARKNQGPKGLFADSRRKVIYLQYMPSTAFVRYTCEHVRLTHCCAKMNRVFVTFHS